MRFGAVGFLRPPTDGVAPNMVPCRGQVIPVRTGRIFNVLFSLGASHHGTHAGWIEFRFEDGTTASGPFGFTDWAWRPALGEETAFTLPVAGEVGRSGARFRLWLQRTPVPREKRIVAIRLPEIPNAKIVALTFGWREGVRPIEPPPKAPRPDPAPVAIFCEPGFPYFNVRADLTPHRIRAALARLGIGAALLSIDHLKDPAVFRAGASPLLINPYGNTFPADAEENIRAFREAGGSMVHLGVPFTHPVARTPYGGFVDRRHTSELLGHSGERPMGAGGFLDAAWRTLQPERALAAWGMGDVQWDRFLPRGADPPREGSHRWGRVGGHREPRPRGPAEARSDRAGPSGSLVDLAAAGGEAGRTSGPRPGRSAALERREDARGERAGAHRPLGWRGRRLPHPRGRGRAPHREVPEGRHLRAPGGGSARHPPVRRASPGRPRRSRCARLPERGDDDRGGRGAPHRVPGRRRALWPRGRRGSARPLRERRRGLRVGARGSGGAPEPAPPGARRARSRDERDPRLPDRAEGLHLLDLGRTRGRGAWRLQAPGGRVRVAAPRGDARLDPRHRARARPSGDRAPLALREIPPGDRRSREPLLRVGPAGGDRAGFARGGGTAPPPGGEDLPGGRDPEREPIGSRGLGDVAPEVFGGAFGERAADVRRLYWERVDRSMEELGQRFLVLTAWRAPREGAIAECARIVRSAEIILASFQDEPRLSPAIASYLQDGKPVVHCLFEGVPFGAEEFQRGPYAAARPGFAWAGIESESLLEAVTSPRNVVRVDPLELAELLRRFAAERPLEEVPLVAAGSVWKHDDRGTDLGRAWRAPDYDDAQWPSGPAELGFGDAAEGRPEATRIGFGDDPEAKNPCAYFRLRFEVADPAEIEKLALEILCDDGCVAYLNGREVGRWNMPEGEIAYRTFAARPLSGEEEERFHAFDVDPRRLRRGGNVLAVEVHQSDARSSDMSFDARLTAWRRAKPRS